jgi:hypothetical protein
MRREHCWVFARQEASASFDRGRSGFHLILWWVGVGIVAREVNFTRLDFIQSI